MKNIVVLISGNGSNLQALIDACQQGRIVGNICAVFSDNPDAHGFKRATALAVPTQVLDVKACPDPWNPWPDPPWPDPPWPDPWSDQATFDVALAAAIDQSQPSLLLLAGYMRILSSVFVRHYTGRLLNIHPSLLPKYPGLHTHRKAIESGDHEHGTSVHFVTEQLDGGPVILQARVPILAGDHEDNLIRSVLIQEHKIYPQVVNWFTRGRLVMREGRAWLDGILLPIDGYAVD